MSDKLSWIFKPLTDVNSNFTPDFNKSRETNPVEVREFYWMSLFEIRGLVEYSLLVEIIYLFIILRNSELF